MQGFKEFMLQEAMITLPYSILKKLMDDAHEFMRRIGPYAKIPKVLTKIHGKAPEFAKEYINQNKINTGVFSDLIYLRVPKSMPELDQDKEPRVRMFYTDEATDYHGIMMMDIGNSVIENGKYKEALIIINTKDYMLTIMETIEHEIIHYLNKLRTKKTSNIEFGSGPEKSIRLNNRYHGIYRNADISHPMPPGVRHHLGNLVHKFNQIRNKITDNKSTPEEMTRYLDMRREYRDIVAKYATPTPHPLLSVEASTNLNSLFYELVYVYMMSMRKSPELKADFDNQSVQKNLRKHLSKFNDKEKRKEFFKDWVAKKGGGERAQASYTLDILREKDPILYRYYLSNLHDRFVEKDFTRSDLLKFLRPYVGPLMRFDDQKADLDAKAEELSMRLPHDFSKMDNTQKTDIRKYLLNLLQTNYYKSIVGVNSVADKADLRTKIATHRKKYDNTQNKNSFYTKFANEEDIMKLIRVKNKEFYPQLNDELRAEFMSTPLNFKIALMGSTFTLPAPSFHPNQQKKSK